MTTTVMTATTKTTTTTLTSQCLRLAEHIDTNGHEDTTATTSFNNNDSNHNDNTRSPAGAWQSTLTQVTMKIPLLPPASTTTNQERRRQHRRQHSPLAGAWPSTLTQPARAKRRTSRPLGKPAIVSCYCPTSKQASKQASSKTLTVSSILSSLEVCWSEFSRPDSGTRVMQRAGAVEVLYLCIYIIHAARKCLLWPPSPPPPALLPFPPTLLTPPATSHLLPPPLHHSP